VKTYTSAQSRGVARIIPTNLSTSPLLFLAVGQKVQYFAPIFDPTCMHSERSDLKAEQEINNLKQQLIAAMFGL